MAKKSNFDYKDLTKSQQSCLSLIESLGIYELRALARVFGDSAPTTIKRNDHINFVMNKILAGDDLQPLPLRQGRPYKELSNINGILAELSSITGKDYSIKSAGDDKPHVNKVVQFKQVDVEIYRKKINPIRVSGVLCDKSEKEMFLQNQSGERKSVLVKKSNYPTLQPYDFITGTAVEMNANKEYILDTLDSVNFENAKTYQRKTVELQPTLPEKRFAFGQTSLLLGGRYMLNTPKFAENPTTKNLVSKLKSNGIVTIGLFPNVMPEEETLLKQLGFDNVFALPYEDNPYQINETLNIFVEHIKHLQQCGFSLAVFVEDFVSIANIVDFAFKNNSKTSMGHTEASNTLVKKVVMLAKADKSGHNTTLFTTVDDVDKIDPLFVSAVYKVCNKVEL